jgi:hypothetical protein
MFNNTYWKKMNNENEVQECDATMNHRDTNAGNPKKTILSLSLLKDFWLNSPLSAFA